MVGWGGKGDETSARRISDLGGEAFPFGLYGSKKRRGRGVFSGVEKGHNGRYRIRVYSWTRLLLGVWGCMDHHGKKGKKNATLPFWGKHVILPGKVISAINEVVYSPAPCNKNEEGDKEGEGAAL